MIFFSKVKYRLADINTYWFIAVRNFFFSTDYKNASYTTSLRILGSLFLQMVSLTALTTYLFSE